MRLKTRFSDLELVEDSAILQVLDEQVPELGVVLGSRHVLCLCEANGCCCQDNGTKQTSSSSTAAATSASCFFFVGFIGKHGNGALAPPTGRELYPDQDLK